MTIICNQCGKINVEPKFKLCPKCREYYRIRHNRKIEKEINKNLACRYCKFPLNTNPIWLYDNQLYIYCNECHCFLSSINIIFK